MTLFLALFCLSGAEMTQGAKKKSIFAKVKEAKKEKEAEKQSGKTNALAEQLNSLKQPEKLDTNAKAVKLTETPLSKAVELSKTTGKTVAGVPVIYITTTQKFKASAAFDQQILLNPSVDVIYPGSVLLGHTIASGTYKEVTKGTKNPITVSYDLTNIKNDKGQVGKVTGEMVPSLSNYRKLHNQIMGQQIGKASTIYSFEETTVYSESDFGIKFNFGVGFNTGVVETKISTGFDFGKGAKKHKYMIKFMETFYTVDVNQGKDTFLYKNFNISDFQGYRPVYVASIAYGRLAYLTIESDESWDKIKADLDVAVDASIYGKYDAKIESTVNNLTKNNKINITVIGGSTVAISLESFLKELTNGSFSKDNPGKIIAYKLRFVDDNTIANTVYNDEYTVTKTSEQMGKGIDTTFTLYKIKTNANDGAGSSLELYGNVEIKEGSTVKSLWSPTRAARKKYKERGEAKENATVSFRVPNDNAAFDVTFYLREADGLAKDDDEFTNAAGTNAGNMAKKIMLNNFQDGEDLVIRAYAIKKGKKREILPNEWVEFYIRVNKKDVF